MSHLKLLSKNLYLFKVLFLFGVAKVETILKQTNLFLIFCFLYIFQTQNLNNFFSEKWIAKVKIFYSIIQRNFQYSLKLKMYFVKNLFALKAGCKSKVTVFNNQTFLIVLKSFFILIYTNQ